jgi:GNAT superfamily N-acetyltransferase
MTHDAQQPASRGEGVAVEVRDSTAMTPAEHDEVRSLLRLAYAEELDDYYARMCPNTHLLGRLDGRIVAHAMVVPRWLQPEGHAPLHTGYVELVATHPAFQRRGYARALLRRVPMMLQDYALGALSPSDHTFYTPLGWELWRGPLSVRTVQGLEATPDEEVMVLRLPRTPATLDLSSGISIEWRPGEVW